MNVKKNKLNEQNKILARASLFLMKFMLMVNITKCALALILT